VCLRTSVIDEFGDHIHSCKKHKDSTKAAHDTLLDALEALCFQAGIKMERRNIPSATKPNGKIGRGDLVLKNVNLGGHRHLIIDVALNHEFGGSHMADVARNGVLRAADPAKPLEATARTKIGTNHSPAPSRHSPALSRHSPALSRHSPALSSTFQALLGTLQHFPGTRPRRRTRGDTG